jgi:hypothetical protein
MVSLSRPVSVVDAPAPNAETIHGLDLGPLNTPFVSVSRPPSIAGAPPVSNDDPFNPYVSTSRPVSLAESPPVQGGEPVHGLGLGLGPPVLPFVGSVSDASTPRQSYFSSQNNSQTVLPVNPPAQALEQPLGEPPIRNQPAEDEKSPGVSNNRRFQIIFAALVTLGVVIIAIVVPVTLIKSRKSPTAAGSSGPSGPGSPTASAAPTPQATSGGDGSVVTKSDGTTFTYNNKFGGFC